MRLTHETDILAPPDRVWSLTEDLAGWPEVTPTMTSVERLDDGPLRAGSRARVVQPRQRPAIWRVRSVEPPHAFVWEATTAGVQLVAGHHLTEVDGGTRNLLVLDVLGARAPVVGRLAGPLMRRALATENDGFRRAAEGLVRPRVRRRARHDARRYPSTARGRRCAAYVEDLVAMGEREPADRAARHRPAGRLRGRRGAGTPPAQPRRAAPVLRLRPGPPGRGARPRRAAPG